MSKVHISLSAKNYADALVQIGQGEVLSYDDILNNLETAKTIISSSSDLHAVLINPTISEEIKISIINEVFSKQINEKIIDFFKILINKNRFNEFDSIIEAYKKELDEINNIKRIEVISAIELSEDTKKRIVEKLQNKLQKQIISKWHTDLEIIGGLVIKIEDDVIDSSIKSKLENLSKSISL